MASYQNLWMTTNSLDSLDKNLDHLKIFTDHVEIVDGDDQTVTDNFHQYYQQSKEDFDQIFNFDQSLSYIEEEQAQELTLFEENYMNNDDHASNDDEDNNREEVVLSQRLSQLTTTTTTTTTMDSPQKAKRFRQDNDDLEEKDRTPYYLLTENKKFFDQLMEQNRDTILDKEEVRQLAYFIHYLAYYEQLYQLWSMYLQACTGKLKEEEEEAEKETEVQSTPMHLRYCPTHVKSALTETDGALPADTTKEQEQLAYEKFIHRRLSEYEEKLNFYQQELSDKKHLLNTRLTFTMEQAIEIFVQKYGITPFRMKCESAINILYCDYDHYLLLYEFKQQKSTTYQRQIFASIYTTNFQLESLKNAYLADRQRILYDQPLISYDALEISLPFFLTSLSDPVLNRQYRDDYEKLIQQTKTDLMVVHLAAIEANIHQSEQIYQQEKKQMFENHQKHVNDKEMTPVLLRLIEQRAKIMMKKIQLRSHFAFNYYLRSPYGQYEMIMKRKISHNQRIGFLPNFIIDPSVTSELNHRQRHLLNRGPTYVAPCQMQAALSFQSIDSVVTKQYAPLHHSLAVLFDKYPKDPIQTSDNLKRIKADFRELFSIMIPKIVCERAMNEQKLIQSIRHRFKQDHLLLRRTADQNNVFYLMNRNSFEEKCFAFMKQTEDHYEVLCTFDGTNQQEIRFQLDAKIHAFNTELEKIFKGNKNTDKLFPKFRIKLDEMKLPYLYFLPDLSSPDHERQVSVKPMFSSYGSLTWKLAKYLYRLLQPFITSVMQRTMIFNESDFMEKLHHYCRDEKRLHPTTIFASIKITNFHSTFSTEREFISDLLAFFLKTHNQPNKPSTISVDSIQKLIELFVRNNFFYYDGKIYSFRKGAPNSMHFSGLLSNVHTFLWQKQMFDDTRLKTEFFVRYNDRIFFTWNHAESDLHTFLDTIKKEYQRNFKFNFSTGRSVNYLNVHLENRSGLLYCCPYHPFKRAKLVLPYVVGHAKNNHCHWFRSALVRTVQLSTNYQDFDQERIYLEMSCLLSGYSIDFIENELKNFYHVFEIDAYRFGMNENVYEKLRRRLLNFIDTQRRNKNKDWELEDQGRLIHLYYLYDYGPYRQFKAKFADIWSKYIATHSKLTANNIKVVLNARHLFSLHTLLAEQKPSCALLL